MPENRENFPEPLSQDDILDVLVENWLRRTLHHKVLSSIPALNLLLHVEPAFSPQTSQNPEYLAASI